MLYRCLLYRPTPNVNFHTMTECVPFIKVTDIGKTIEWYQSIGFTCVATNHIWEPDCELNWARLEWDGAAFMLGPDERNTIISQKDTSLWFNVDTVDNIVRNLEVNAIEMNVEPETFYGRKVISFKDINGFGVSFSSALKK